MSKGAKSAGGVSDADLRLALRETLVRLAKPTSAAELRKALPKPHQRPVAEITRLLYELARDRSLFAFQEGKTEKYSLRDPKEATRQAVLAALRDKPLTKTDLTARVKREAPGFEKLLPKLLPDLLKGGAVREHPKVGKTSARYGLEPPDPAPFLAKAVKEILAVHKKLEPCGVPLASLYAALGRALKIGDGAIDDESAMLAALRELSSRQPPGALLSVRDLRAMLPLPKARFDGAALRLSKAGKVVLHHHDFPASLPEPERAELVRDDGGVHYIGIVIAPRKRPS